MIKLIREATERDLEKIADMKIKIYEEADIKEWLADNAKQQIISVYKELYKNGEAKHFVIEENGEIVSAAGGIIRSDIPFLFYKKPYYGNLVDVYTYFEYRGKGYATLLAKEAVKWMKTKDIFIIRLTTSQKAKGIYEKIGFENADEYEIIFENSGEE